MMHLGPLISGEHTSEIRNAREAERCSAQNAPVAPSQPSRTVGIALLVPLP
jgi:hypothetical protein